MKTPNTKLYMVYAYAYGSYIHVFGVFSSLDRAEEVKKFREEYFRKQFKCDPERITFNIKEVFIDENINDVYGYLGGYSE